MNVRVTICTKWNKTACFLSPMNSQQLENNCNEIALKLTSVCQCAVDSALTMFYFTQPQAIIQKFGGNLDAT